jgi:hypothetical protein
VILHTYADAYNDNTETNYTKLMRVKLTLPKFVMHYILDKIRQRFENNLIAYQTALLQVNLCTTHYFFCFKMDQKFCLTCKVQSGNYFLSNMTYPIIHLNIYVPINITLTLLIIFTTNL